MRSTMHVSSHPLHPMMVFFPLGLWTTSLFFDALGWMWQDPLLIAAGFYCVVGGCVGAALAAVPGVIDLFTVVPPNSSGKKRGLVHGGLNSLGLVLWAFIAWRRGSPTEAIDGTSVLLSLAGVAGVLFSGWLGATLVYRNQIGVDHRYANAGKWKERTLESWERPVCNQKELGEGQMMLGHIAGERVVVAKCGHGTATFSDHCTHRGGPLSDGVLIGCTVQCPWHGSNFDVHSGRVVAGPAKEKIATYEHESRAGEIYVEPPAGTAQRRKTKVTADEGGQDKKGTKDDQAA
jgi:uncharacterized membrane protein/nitrite reductase/ring-hydroxylating ferredoxin subunit